MRNQIKNFVSILTEMNIPQVKFADLHDYCDPNPIALEWALEVEEFGPEHLDALNAFIEEWDAFVSLSNYQKQIFWAAKAEVADCAEIEEMMREEYNTLDHLSWSQFLHCAISCKDALLWSRTPEGQAYIDELNRQMDRRLS